MANNMRELLERYELYARARGFSLAYIKHICRCVGFFDDFLQGNTDASKVTADDFRRFLSDLRERPAWGGLKGEKGRRLSGTAQNTYARAVKAFFGWLKAEGVITNNPLAAVPAPRKPKTMPKVYSGNELNAVFEAAAANIRDQSIFYLFLDSGVRLAELSLLKVADVDTQDGRIKVLGKGGKERFAYFSPVTAASLDIYVKKHRSAATRNERLFLAADGHPLSASGIQSLLERLGRKAGIKERLAPHKLRHTWATLSLKYGGNLEYIKKILGHSDIQTTSEAYLNVQDEDVKAAYRNFSPLANLKTASAGKGFVLPDEGKPADQQEIPKGKIRQKAHEETSYEQKQLLNSKQESPQQLARDRSIGEHERTETGERLEKADAGLRPIFQELYREHLRKLVYLTGELIADIENGNLEPPRRPAKTNPKSMFGGMDLVRVYCAQNKPLWPFLLQHLNNEFHDPALGGQIAQIATAAFWSHHINKESYDSSPADLVREKLLLVSERGTFKGTCTICEDYLLHK